jgi:hypothetical protein
MSDFMKVRLGGAELLHADGMTDGQTDTHDEADSRAPEKGKKYTILLSQPNPCN